MEERTVSFELYFWFPQKQYDSKPRPWKVLERTCEAIVSKCSWGTWGSGVTPSSIVSRAVASWRPHSSGMRYYCPHPKDRQMLSASRASSYLLCTHPKCLLTVRNGDTVAATHLSYL